MTENQLAEMFENIRSLKAMTKEVMTINECAQYTGLSVSYLYKLTHRKLIPFFKPMGKRVYFKRTEIDQWLLRNKQGGIYEAS
ncbi:helix-turn-helix domain-containing protein [Vibrio parahaemolyticus]|uniref:Helix-turn-helix domain-containing protein n=1 Tax=Vibrio cholerae TaxID=666 RepID=A0A8B5ZN81_VIBCL|nr:MULTISPECIES: helix-turn-helix domain-containing protein [Vibrio]EJG0223858.1 helix-turn-helix domain-containing protein [Vibrio parahaemolyticus]EJG0347886.1 helix-turn-helix domain-containing protein [Vibrio parahaemolyticus]EJG0551692.1 helix-turn-helix domain-containing protein [Vibrio parahaemolyticus]MBJ6953242.1 helix-turn-helix domain-containing protein [Vibrio cholerae]TXY93636.1 helix-turn-helix domain-containing protein [Vibrio cholerae]